MILFENILVRISNLSVEDYSSVTIEPMIDQLQILNEVNKKIKIVQEDLSNILYLEIEQSADRKVQNKLLNLKRDIFNGRNIYHKINPKIIDHLSQNSLNHINKYLDLIGQREKEIKKIEEHYFDIILKKRKQLRLLGKNKLFLNSLMFSNLSLLEQFQKYCEKDIEDYSKKELQTERSILKYFTRMVYKTTPLATFTSISISRIEYDDSKPDWCISGTSDLIEKLSINSIVLKYFLELIKLDKIQSMKLKISLNPTIEFFGEKIRFLTNFHNTESFQIIENNEALEFIISYFKQHELSLITLLDALANEFGEEESHLYKYIKFLLDIGFLEFRFGIISSDPDWVNHFEDFLKQFSDNSDDLDQMYKLLKNVKLLINEFSQLDINSRKKKINLLFNSIKDFSIKYIESHEKLLMKEPVQEKTGLFRNHPVKVFPIKKETLFYCDSSKNLKLISNSQHLKSITQTLDDFILAISVLDSVETERKKLKSFIRNKYQSFKRIPLLQLYEDFSKTSIQNAQTREREIEKDQVEQKWINELKLKFTNHNNNDEINIDLTELNSINKAIGFEEPSKKYVSNGAFLHLLTEDPLSTENNKYKAVVNNIFSGYGRMMSRYLYIYDNNTVNNIKEFNKFEDDKESLLAEIFDASFFNANVHPDLLEYKIWMPGSTVPLNDSYTILVSNLYVTLDTLTDQMELYDSITKKRVLPISLTFQANQGRSPLFRLIHLFTPARVVNFKRFCFLLSKDTGDDKIKILPRIVLGNIVLQRKKWVFNIKLISLFDEALNPIEFIKINNWLSKHEIPKTCFYKLLPINDKDSKKFEKHKKPQFLNFEDPMMLEVFKRSVRQMECLIELSECLPNNNQMLKLNDKSYSSEVLIQWK